MLIVRTTELTAKPITWHIGEDTDAIHDVADAGRIQYLKASAEELRYIDDRNFNVRYVISDGGFTTWYGDDARFIAGNL
jgi:hypothetical protein